MHTTPGASPVRCLCWQKSERGVIGGGSAVAGLLLIGYLVVQAAMIDHLDWFYAACCVFGVAMFGLATTLWMTEYRSHHFPVRPVGHA
jgi:hypothetical protein